MLCERMVVLIVALLLLPLGAGAFQVFEDPTDLGTNPGAPLVVGPGAAALNLYYSHVGSTSATPCSGGVGGSLSGLCGWDVHVSALGGAVLTGFVPEIGLDIVWHIDPVTQVLRMNGGDPINGEGTVVQRLGTLSVSVNGSSDTVATSGNLFVTGQLSTQAVPSGTLLLTDVCVGQGGDTDGDTICNNQDPCDVFANTLPLNGGPPGAPNADDNGDGIPNECQCGDITGDGLIGFDDATCYAQCVQTAPGPACACSGVLSDTNSDNLIGFDDATRAAQVVQSALQTWQMGCVRRPNGEALP